MIVRTTDPVPLERIQLAMKAPASDTIARRPRTKIAGIDASRKVVVVAHVVDPDSKAMGNRQRLFADETLSYDCKTGDYRVSGKGQFQLNVPFPKASDSGNGGIPPFEQSEISFNTGMKTTWSFENEAELARSFIEFTGDVRLARLATEGTRSTVKPDGGKNADGYFEAQGLRIIVDELPRRQHAPVTYRVHATFSGGVKVVSDGHIAELYNLHYDSSEN